MALDINKLIADQKAAQAKARTAADKAAAAAIKAKADSKVTAASKVQLDYANTLKPSLAAYEGELKIWANKIARGDKLSTIEQKDFDRLLANYNSVNKTIDAAIKKANDILIAARRGPSGPTATTAVKPTSTKATSAPAAGSPIASGATLLGKTVTATKAPAPTTTKVTTPTKTPVVASKTPVTVTASGPTGPTVTGTGTGTATAPTGVDAAIAKAIELYGMPDIIFSNVPSLGKLLQKYVNNEINLDTFVKEVANDTWYRQNSTEIKARYLQKFNYDSLVKSGQATGNSDYEKQIATITSDVMTRAKAQGAAIDETQAKLIAQDLYIHNMESDTTSLIKRISTSIRPVALGGTLGTGYTGKALTDLQTLQDVAKSNGLKLENIVPNRLGTTATSEQIQNDVLGGLQDGTIDVTRLTQNARLLASQGQPQYVRDLLNQGYNLDAVYSPYRKIMADTLGLDQNTIDLNDPSLRMAISDKGDTNIYDYQKALRKDTRWQYTQQANAEVADATQQVLKDFGFMG